MCCRVGFTGHLAEKKINILTSEEKVMSFYGNVCFFTETHPAHPHEWVNRVIDLVGAQENTTFEYNQTTRLLHEWEDFKKERDYGVPAPNTFNQQWMTRQYTPSINPEMIRNFDYDSAVLSISAYPAKILDVSEAVDARIPESIRGTFHVQDFEILIGEHDIFTTEEAQDDEDGIFFGRAFFEFHFCGQGAPNDWEEMRRVVFEVPEIIDFKQQLEKIIGPVKTCAHWA